MSMTNEQLEHIHTLLASYPAVKLGYLFGSRVNGKTGPLSDYDFAFYADERDTKRLFDIKITLQQELSRLLATDRVDVMLLNLAESPELKYAVISEGRLLYEMEGFRVLVEPKILNEYFDFRALLRRYALTRS